MTTTGADATTGDSNAGNDGDNAVRARGSVDDEAVRDDENAAGRNDAVDSGLTWLEEEEEDEEEEAARK